MIALDGTPARRIPTIYFSWTATELAEEQYRAVEMLRELGYRIVGSHGDYVYREESPNWHSPEPKGPYTSESIKENARTWIQQADLYVSVVSEMPSPGTLSSPAQPIALLEYGMAREIGIARAFFQCRRPVSSTGLGLNVDAVRNQEEMLRRIRSGEESIVSYNRSEELIVNVVRTVGRRVGSPFRTGVATPGEPPELRESLREFRRRYPDPRTVAFLMMDFSKTPAHTKIATAVRIALRSLGIQCLRSDDYIFHDDLFPNVLTYMHGCGLGVAVFERINADRYNPNVALEVGYMRALGKPVCLLKDKTMVTLQADLIGKIYSPFDTQHVETSIPPVISKWLDDKGFTKPPTHQSARFRA